MTKKTRLTDADRLQIEILLKQRYPLSRIAEQIGKSKSTIAREIKK
jgi:IS30 family transposase